MAGISVSKICVPFGGGGVDWSSYWTTHLFGEDDLAFRATSRSGLTLADTIGTDDVSILIPVAKFNGTNNRLTGASTAITGGQAWDFTIVFRLTNAAANTPLFNCGGYSGAVKGLMLRVNNGTVNVFTSDGTASAGANFATGLTTNTLYTLRLQWSGVTGETMTVTVNGAALTSTTTRGWADAPTDAFELAKYSTVYGAYTLHSIVGGFGGLTVYLVPTGLSTVEIELSVIPKVFNWYGDTGHYAYDSGNTYFLDNGFSIWKDAGDVYQYIGYGEDGEPIAAATLLGGTYAKVSDTEGSVNHNLWNSKLRFTGDFWDRSNATIWGDAARLGYYDAGSVKDFHISELNGLTLKSWLNDGYAGTFYLKYSDNSVDGTGTLNSMWLYASDYKDDDQLNILRYSQDIRRTQRDIDGVYILDANDYVELYTYANLGGDAEANYAKYQALVTAANTTIGAGYNEYDVIKISRPITPPAGRTVAVNCELRIKDGTTVDLTSDVTAGDTVINVSSVVGFNVGEWIAISDGVLAVQGGSGQTRRVAASGRITEIGVSTLTIHSGSRYNVASASGHVGHAQSVILIDTANNVTVNGTGILNGNRLNQYDVEPVATSGIEEIKELCGVSVMYSNNCSIGSSGAYLRAKNCGLHGVAVIGTSDLARAQSNIVQYIHAFENHDKGVLMAWTNLTNFNHIISEDQLFEDGITVYAGNTNYSISDIETSGSPRGGVNIVADPAAGSNGTVARMSSADDIYISGKLITLSDLEMIGSSQLYIHDQYSGDNITINGITFDGCTGNQVQLVGGLADIAINDLVITGCTSTTAAIIADENAGNGQYPQNVVITGGGIYDHTGTKTAIDVNADVTFTDFDGLP